MGDCVGVGIRLRFWPALNAVAVKVTMSSNVLLIVYGLPFPHTRITILHRVALHLIFESMSIFLFALHKIFQVHWQHLCCAVVSLCFHHYREMTVVQVKRCANRLCGLGHIGIVWAKAM